MHPTVDSASAPTGPVEIQPGLTLPLPDEASAIAARDRLSSVDIGVNAPTVTALGALAEAVVVVAGLQGSAFPRPFLSTRVILLSGSHAGGLVAGPAPDPRQGIPLQRLAAAVGAGIVTLEWHPASAAIEHDDAITAEQMQTALRAGWSEADRAADEGIELLVLAAGGMGATTAASAVVAAITGAEPPAMLSRVVTPAGRYDDNAWMTRCVAVRDALHRVRTRDGDPRNVISALGGADIAAATGLLLGAAQRRIPVMIDGPVGAAAALLANDFSPQAIRWLLMPDHGRHPAVMLAANTLGLRTWLDLRLDLGEGSAALAALPMLQTALTLAGAGESASAQPLTRFDASGSRIFVGVARPIDPARTDEEIAAEAIGETAAGWEANPEKGPAPASADVGSDDTGDQAPDSHATGETTGSAEIEPTDASISAGEPTVAIDAPTMAISTTGSARPTKSTKSTVARPAAGKNARGKAPTGRNPGGRTSALKAVDAKTTQVKQVPAKTPADATTSGVDVTAVIPAAVPAGPPEQVSTPEPAEAAPAAGSPDATTAPDAIAQEAVSSDGNGPDEVEPNEVGPDEFGPDDGSTGNAPATQPPTRAPDTDGATEPPSDVETRTDTDGQGEVTAPPEARPETPTRTSTEPRKAPSPRAGTTKGSRNRRRR